MGMHVKLMKPAGIHTAQQALTSEHEDSIFVDSELKELFRGYPNEKGFEQTKMKFIMTKLLRKCSGLAFPNSHVVSSSPACRRGSSTTCL